MNAFVLAGGQSTRMGRDKALLPLDGRPLIEHMLDKMRGLGLHARICGSRPDLAQFAEVVADNFAGSGPLAGIEAALAVSDSELNLFVPVDLPGLPAGVSTLADGAGRGEPGGGDDPTLRRSASAALRRLQPPLAGGPPGIAHRGPAQSDGGGSAQRLRHWSIDRRVRRGDVLPLPGLPIGRQRPLLTEWFRNVNTPADYEALRAASLQLRSVAKGRHPIS